MVLFSHCYYFDRIYTVLLAINRYFIFFYWIFSIIIFMHKFNLFERFIRKIIFLWCKNCSFYDKLYFSNFWSSYQFNTIKLENFLFFYNWYTIFNNRNFTIYFFIRKSFIFNIKKRDWWTYFWNFIKYITY